MASYLKNGKYKPHFITAKTPKSLDKISDWYKDKYREAKDNDKKDMIPYYGDLPPDTLDNNIKEAKKMSFDEWVNSVREGGKWDYKKQHDNYALADFGNFNYGATGRSSGVSSGVLLKGGDGVQFLQHGTFDDPRDQEMIQDGIDYYDEYYASQGDTLLQDEISNTPLFLDPFGIDY